MSAKSSLFLTFVLMLLSSCKTATPESDAKAVVSADEDGKGFLLAYAPEQSQEMICFKRCNTYEAKTEDVNGKKVLILSPEQECKFAGAVDVQQARDVKGKLKENFATAKMVDPLVDDILKPDATLFGYLEKDDRRDLLEQMVEQAKVGDLVEKICQRKTKDVKVSSLSNKPEHRELTPRRDRRAMNFVNKSKHDLNVNIEYSLPLGFTVYYERKDHSFVLKANSESLLITESGSRLDKGKRFYPLVTSVKVVADIKGVFSYTSEWPQTTLVFNEEYESEKVRYANIIFKGDFSVDLEVDGGVLP